MCARAQLFDYADYSERLLGMRAFVIYDRTSGKNVAASVAKFDARFGDRLVAVDGCNQGALRSLFERERIAHVYIIKAAAARPEPRTSQDCAPS